MYRAGFVLLLGSWLQPLHIQPWVSWHSEVLAFAGLAWIMGVQMLEMKRAGESHLVLPKAALIPMVLGLYALIQFSLGQIEFFGDALVIAIYMLACGAAITAGYRWGSKPVLLQQVRTTETLLEQIAWAVLLGAFLSVGIMLIQALGIWTSIEWIVRTEGYRRPGGNVAQTNHMATLILMGTASLAWLYETRRLGAVAAGMLQLMLVLGLAMTESRTGLLSALVLTFWWFSRRGVFERVRGVRPVVYAWVGLLLLVWAWPIFLESGYYLNSEGAGRIHVGVGVRRVVWVQLLEAALQRPWAGWGLREVSEAHNTVLHLYHESAPFTYAHSLPIDLVVGLGFPLALLLLGVCGYWLWSRMKKADTPAGWYYLALALPLAVHSLLEFPHAYAYFLIPVLLAIGMAEGSAVQRGTMRIRLAQAAIGAGALFLLMAWSVVEYVAIEEDFRVARFEALLIGKTPDDYKVPDTILLTQLDAMLKATRYKPAPGMAAKEVELLRQAAMRFPWPAIQNRYALSLALNGHPQEAVRQMQVMRAMHGEQPYQGIRASWELLAKEKYPQLKNMTLP